MATGRKTDDWYFEPSLMRAGAADKWRTQPIGGEIRPELWQTSFTSSPHPRDQGFIRCVERTHASWLMDSGLFGDEFRLDSKRKANAFRQVGRLGYELHVSKAEWRDGRLSLTVENRGVAPFYHDWPVELRTVYDKTLAPKSWRPTAVMPGRPVVWDLRIDRADHYRFRVRNPMKGGKPLRFANAEQGDEWLEIRFSE